MRIIKLQLQENIYSKRGEIFRSRSTTFTSQTLSTLGSSFARENSYSILTGWQTNCLLFFGAWLSILIILLLCSFCCALRWWQFLLSGTVFINETYTLRKSNKFKPKPFQDPSYSGLAIGLQVEALQHSARWEYHLRFHDENFISFILLVHPLMPPLWTYTSVQRRYKVSDGRLQRRPKRK